MGYPQHHHFTISFLILVISATLFNAQGRKLAHTPDNSQTMREGKTTWRAQIGSKPPRCERRCGSCARCEAIQVPTNPQIKNSISANYITNARDDDNSNYKPMSWKCKCGSLVFNP